MPKKTQVKESPEVKTDLPFDCDPDAGLATGHPIRFLRQFRRALSQA